MQDRRIRTRVFFLAMVVASLGVAATLQAVLVPAVGPGTGVGRIEHAIFNTVAGGMPAVFDGHFNPVIADGGDMSAPGFNFPAIAGAPLFENDTGAIGLIANVPVTWTTPAHLPTGFGGATTTMVGVGGGGRAGIATTNFNLFDNAPLGRASTNTFAGSVDYINIGGPIIGRYAHFLSASAVSPVGGYVAAGVKSVIEVDPAGGVGLAFNPVFFWEPLPIIMAFDGVAVGNPNDFIQAQFFRFNAVGQALTFSGISTTPILTIPAGASVRIRGTVTLIADPDGSMEFEDLPPDLVAEAGAIDFGMGGSGDALNYIPEPTALAPILLGALMLGRRQRQTRHVP